MFHLLKEPPNGLALAVGGLVAGTIILMQTVGIAAIGAHVTANPLHAVLGGVLGLEIPQLEQIYQLPELYAHQLFPNATFGLFRQN